MEPNLGKIAKLEDGLDDSEQEIVNGSSFFMDPSKEVKGGVVTLKSGRSSFYAKCKVSFYE